jgi:predicted type IV restriction endonuclease
MKQQLVEFFDGIKSNKQVGSFDEASTKQAIVLRLLFLLGWDIFNVDEVNPNLANETQQADYALSIKNTRKVFIKVVRPKEALDQYQEKVFEYASEKGVEFAILTNGVIWWFYLSSNKGNALQNRFVILDFLKQKPNDIEEQLTSFLKRDEISKGAAKKRATDILKKSLQQAAQKAIPEAWSKILSEPHETLIKLIGETAEKMCGVPAEKDAIVNFLSEFLKQPQKTEAPAMHLEEKAAPKTEKAVSPPEKAAQKSYDGQSITSFSLKGKTYKVKSWEELLVKLCEVLKTEYHQDIDSLQWHSVGKKYYFNTNQNELRFPAGIAGTDVFVETYLNPNEAVKVALSVLSEFGFAGNDLKINN